MKIWSTESRTSTQLEDTVGPQILRIPAIVEDSVVRLYGEAEQTTKSGLDSEVMAAIRIVVNQLDGDIFYISFYQQAVRRAVHMPGAAIFCQ